MDRNMPYTPMSDLGQQGLFDVTRILLQQPDLTSLALSLTQIVVKASLAEQVNILFFTSAHQRVRFYGINDQDKEMQNENERVLASGPMQQVLVSLKGLVCTHSEFVNAWPQVAALNIYSPFGHYCLQPLVIDGKIVGGCEFIRSSKNDWSEKELNRLQTLAPLAALAAEQIQIRLDKKYDHQLLRHERDDYRILVAVTNAVLSKLDLHELVSVVARKLYSHFAIDSISVALRSNRQGWLRVYKARIADEADEVSPIQEECEVAEVGTPSEQVFRNEKMLVLNQTSSNERTLQDRWGNKTEIVCLLPLKFGNKMLGVLELNHRDARGFSPSNLKLLGQIAERVSIAVDNALAYQEINRLKENLIDENVYLNEQINNVTSEFGGIIGRGEAMSAVLRQVELVAKSNSTVLILGETGTGKELIARAIHNLSERSGRRMVKINCAAMPVGLLESDLFGHERGAFTGANTQRIGRFELANNSSLFLDEVGDMPLELQPKLLRVLQEREFERLGSNKIQEVDVRLIAATNRDLQQMVFDREFRSDLYYRLNVFPIILPPLRERLEDLPMLVKSLTFKIARRMKRNIDNIPAETLRALSRLEWPGNVRELENVLERAVLLTQGNVLRISREDMEFSSLQKRNPLPLFSTETREGEDEYQRIIRVLKETNGIIAGSRGAAQRLGLKRTTLLSRMKRLGINKDALF